jgi:drug/metabolite transporter (DMT)-like permease
LLGFVAADGERWVPERADLQGIGIRALLMFAAFHALLFVGQGYTTSAVAAIVVGMNPILTAGFAGFLLPGERLSLVGLSGLVTGFAGVVVLANPDPQDLASGGGFGEALILVGIGVFALGSVLSQRTSIALRPEATTAWSMFTGGVAAHLLSLSVGESAAAIAWTAEGITALLWIALGPGAIGFALLDRIGSVRVNLVNYVVPIVAAMVGWALLDESFGLTTAAGFLLISAEFVLVQRRALREVVPGVVAASW